MRKYNIAPQMRCSLGFTLIDLMITVAIIGILSATAYLSYQDYVKQARRTDAQASLMELAQFMERHYASKSGYLTDGQTGSAPRLPFTSSPKDGANAAYTLALSTAEKNGVTAQAYRLEARPINMMAKDKCGTLTLDYRGKRGIEVEGISGSVSEISNCWKR